ncbi:MAG: hypothetical protein IPP82_15300 [Xanthomonadales bacterium]|nr:hypothetical protein [Xanthomonadales bacterium]
MLIAVGKLREVAACTVNAAVSGNTSNFKVIGPKNTEHCSECTQTLPSTARMNTTR